MEPAKQTDLAHHVYRLKWWAQAWYLTMGIFTGGIGSIPVLAGLVGRDWIPFRDWSVIGLSVGFLLLGYPYFGLALRSRVVLEGTRISVRGAFREKSAEMREIEGYRVTMGKNSTYWRFVLRDGRGTLAIMRTFCVDDTFQAMLARLKNLDDDQALLDSHL